MSHGTSQLYNLVCTWLCISHIDLHLIVQPIHIYYVVYIEPCTLSTTAIITCSTNNAVAGGLGTRLVYIISAYMFIIYMRTEVGDG